ncbi:hypothetical protein PF005_g22048 [Phytophthora fragariae]|uniref:RxLR effector protein n=1 Tax=Phytophthora fragariae TaxID=53985 RepID=A0A6A3DYH6_9STRA|nr:hypothetical protein PF003_g12822 [Phytophthora fragariae]KAE8926749.1 hypothetical protein PF009_g23070 [Phytophthora fragariae]KAE9082539.1 hypothetical protein PF007_g22259 [Phytophthora fragariae]KAE9111217.1 hypothetical protein PF006_g20268 [Phytophthora fragariae]KAE9183538.1 hypothetical protein PF005_g22048 [Phytophthora fragariae]
MKFFSCLALVVLALTTATVSANAAEEIGVKARHMLAMGDESIMFARGSLQLEISRERDAESLLLLHNVEERSPLTSRALDTARYEPDKL